MHSEPSVVLLTVQEVATLLRISHQGVRRLLDKKLIPTIRIMGSIRIDQKDIISYVEQQRTQQVPDEQNDVAIKDNI